MSKTKRFEIYGNEPSGTTFEDVAETKWAGSKNKKPRDNFGIENDEPHGDTFVDPEKSHIDFPKADRGPVLGTKAIAESGGQGEYDPMRAAGRLKSGDGDGQYSGGSVGVGKSSPKHGKTDRLKQDFRA
jgi:hypothetical protein